MHLCNLIAEIFFSKKLFYDLQKFKNAQNKAHMHDIHTGIYIQLAYVAIVNMCSDYINMYKIKQKYS